MMSNFVNQIKLSGDALTQYESAGALKVKNLLSESALASIDEMLTESNDRPSATDNGNYIFSRALYDVGNTHPVTEAICKSDQLKFLVNQLHKNRYYFTQGLYFEMEREKSVGLKWHFGRLSFNYIMPYDKGFTIWIPLDPINPEQQGGGLAYLPENLYSAKEDYKKATLLYDFVRQGKVDRQYAESIRPGAEPELFDAAGVEESFNPGDVLIFNKFVWHKSIPLREGPITKRRAFAMRFIPNDSQYNEEFLALTEYMGLGEYSRYGRSYDDLKHGDLISDSKHCGELI